MAQMKDPGRVLQEFYHGSERVLQGFCRVPRVFATVQALSAP